MLTLSYVAGTPFHFTGEGPATPPVFPGQASPRPCPPQHLSLASSQAPATPPVPTPPFPTFAGPQRSSREVAGTLALVLADAVRRSPSSALGFCFIILGKFSAITALVPSPSGGGSGLRSSSQDHGVVENHLWAQAGRRAELCLLELGPLTALGLVFSVVVKVPSGSRTVHCSLTDHLPGQSSVALRLDQPLDKNESVVSAKPQLQTQRRAHFPECCWGQAKERNTPEAGRGLGAPQPLPPRGADQLQHTFSHCLSHSPSPSRCPT